MLSSIMRSPLSDALQNILSRAIPPSIMIPNPTTVSYSSAQVASGFSGSVSTTKNAARIYGRAGMTIWTGVITGSESKITATSSFGGSALPGMIEVSVDGGVYTPCPNAGTVFTLFTGLASTPHLVIFRFGPTVGDSPYIASSGDVLSVTGQPPSMSPVINWLEAGHDSSTGLVSFSSIINVATYTPSIQEAKGSTYGSNVGSAKIRGSFSKLYVSVNGGARKVGVSKNGEDAIFYSIAEETNKPISMIVIPCDGSASTYNVWDDGNGRTGGGHFSVAGDSTLLDIGMRRRLDQFGDSITFGANASPVYVETMPVAAHLGFVGSTNGISGYTIAQCKTLIDNVLPGKTVGINDVAVLAIGRNNVGAIDATARIDYGLCIDKLVAKGYGKILCRGILPTPNGSSLWATENTALQDVVASKANSNIIFVPTSTWLGYDSTDATHPSSAGYVTLAGFATAAYSSALGL